MLTEQEKKWLKERSKPDYPAACNRAHERFDLSQEDCQECGGYLMYKPELCPLKRAKFWTDSAEFEARVAIEAISLTPADVPCANSMEAFWKTSCPLRNTKIYKDGKLVDFQGEGCGEWCLLRMARLEVEREKEAEECKY